MAWVLGVKLYSPGTGSMFMYAAERTDALFLTTDPDLAIQFAERIDAADWMIAHWDITGWTGLRAYEYDEPEPPAIAPR